MMYTQKKQLFFHGLPLYDVVSVEDFNSDFVISQDIKHYFRQHPPQRYLTITIETAHREEYHSIRQHLARLMVCQGRLISLGTGKVCEHCGTYSPAGRAKCWNCNAPTVDRELIKPMETDLKLCGMNESIVGVSRYDYGLNRLEVEFSFVEMTRSSIMQLFAPSTRIVDIPWSYTLDSSKYICDFCGTVTRSGQNCGGCGGHQLPMRDLVEIEHSCLYCGNSAVGGIICNQCGARLGGKSIHDLLNN